MKKHFLSLLFLVSLAFSVSSQAIGQTAAKADPVQERLRADVAHLASDKLAGRRTGEPGASAAASYIAQEFAKLKLSAKFPATKEKNNYLQPFPYFSGVDLGAENALKIKAGPMTANVVLKSNWMPVGFSSSGSAAETDVVFAGYGIVAEDAKVDDYRGLDVSGKIVLIFDGTPDKGNPHGQFGRFMDVRVKAKIAHDKGAKAMLIISSVPKLEDEPLARLRFDQTLGDTAIPAAVIARPVGAILLGNKSEEELKRDEEFIALRKEAGEIGMNLTGRPKATAEIKVNLVKRKADAYNVIGILEGTDPVLKNEAIVLGAHYDHLGHGGSSSLDPNSTAIHYGADDNASGTSALLELARQFAKAKKNKRTIIFAAFSGEEEGLLGSKYYVNNPMFPIDKTVAMINMDMVGRLKDEKLTVGGIGSATEWKALVEGKNPADSKFTLALSEDGFGPSDHSSFYGKQVPVLFFFTGTHLDYHKPSDTADKINYAGLTNITHYVSSLVKAVDGNAIKPTYKTAQSSGMGGRIGFNISLGTVPSYADSSDGMLLDGVRDNSPAAKAGLKAGDKVIMLAGKEVRNAMDYTQVMSGMKAGEEYEVVIMRGTEKLTLKIVPAPAVRR